MNPRRGRKVRHTVALLGAALVVVLAAVLFRDSPKAPEHVRGVVDGYPTVSANGKVRPGWSVEPGDVVEFRLNGDRPRKEDLDITDALGNRVATLEAVELSPQQVRGDRPWRDGLGYETTVTWSVPRNLNSGMYFLNGVPELFLVVRDPAPPMNRLVVLVSTHTFNAYSKTLGRSHYPAPTRAPVLSFARPMDETRPVEWMSTVQWLLEEQPNDGNISFITDLEMESYQSIAGASVLLVLAHSEYWTREARQNFDRFVEDGGNAVIASGNVMWWQSRLDKNENTLATYKVNESNMADDPETDVRYKTMRWDTPLLDYSVTGSIGASFYHGGYSKHLRPEARGWNGFKIVLPESPILAGLGFGLCELLPIRNPREYDGAPIRGLDENGFPVLDRASMGMRKAEVIAFDWTSRGGGHTLGTMMVMQKAAGSGVVFHMSAKECCGSKGLGSGKDHPLKAILRNGLQLLLADKSVFADVGDAQVVFSMTTPWRKEIPPSLNEVCEPSQPQGTDT